MLDGRNDVSWSKVDKMILCQWPPCFHSASFHLAPTIRLKFASPRVLTTQEVAAPRADTDADADATEMRLRRQPRFLAPLPPSPPPPPLLQPLPLKWGEDSQNATDTNQNLAPGLPSVVSI